MSDAIILLAHGARDPAWARPIEAIAARLRDLVPETPVELAFLELMAPDIATAVELLVAEGARRLRVVPVFLGQAGHVNRDLPARIDAIREKLAATHDDILIELDAAIGEQPEVIEAIAACISQRHGPR